ncbi:MAG: flagellar basal body rod protein [Bacilli bacterium]|nr:flagellar basal body rod protein [Bacilli bacterium]
MKQFLLFLVALVALVVFLFHLGPLVVLLVSVWLLYLIFKQFIKTDSTIAKIGWVILGLIIISISFSNIYAVVGLAALIVLYLVYEKWRENKAGTDDFAEDPFNHFEQQWHDLSK